MIEENTEAVFDPHFSHTVFFWLKEPENTVHRTLFEKELQLFMSTSKYAKTKYIGKPLIATRDVVEASFTYQLTVTFESASAQVKYQEEEAHVIFIESCKDLWKKVVVYDSEGATF